ncbi:hypothetical protein JHK82_033466 [Glycine max]|nr:hypothetical protein JHK82_033466 [Glycine max]
MAKGEGEEGNMATLNQAPHHGGGGHDHDGLKSRLWVVLVPLSQNKKKRETIIIPPYSRRSRLRTSEKDVSSPLKTIEEEKVAEVIDPLGELVKNLFDIYQRPVEVSWDGGHINQAVTFNRSYYKCEDEENDKVVLASNSDLAAAVDHPKTWFEGMIIWNWGKGPIWGLTPDDRFSVKSIYDALNNSGQRNGFNHSFV